MELLLGAGSNHHKLFKTELGEDWKELVTLDINKDHNPDFVWDMNELPLPFFDDWFDEVHAYEVLEHTGRQGDYEFFFKQFEDLHRILKPGGLLCVTVPWYQSEWAWGDPGHTRVITPGTLTFLSQANYADVGKTAMTDYRFCYKADFKCEMWQNHGERLYFCLSAIK